MADSQAARLRDLALLRRVRDRIDRDFAQPLDVAALARHRGLIRRGCASLGTFSTRFTELVGMPPGAYRRAAARGAAGLPSCVVRAVSRPVRRSRSGIEKHPESIRA